LSTGPAGYRAVLAQRLTLTISARDKSGHRSLVGELLRRARRARVAGATVIEATRGFGLSGREHADHPLSHDVPLAFVIVDTSDAIDRFLVEAGDLLDGVRQVRVNLDILTP
jgi:PII-like signaling protein